MASSDATCSVSTSKVWRVGFVIGIQWFVRDVSGDIDLFAGGVAKDGGIRVIGWTNLNVECAEEDEGDERQRRGESKCGCESGRGQRK